MEICFSICLSAVWTPSHHILYKPFHRSLVSASVNTEFTPGWMKCLKFKYFPLAHTCTVLKLLGFIYIRAKANAKAIFSFIFYRPLICSINTQFGNNATDCKRRRFRVHFRSNINEPLSSNCYKDPFTLSVSDSGHRQEWAFLIEIFHHFLHRYR